MIEIIRKRTGITTNINSKVYEAMNAATPKGCPFKGYTFWDLLRDLIKMYSWELSFDRIYTLNDFLTECNCIHAEVYKKDFLRMEATI